MGTAVLQNRDQFYVARPPPSGCDVVAQLNRSLLLDDDLHGTAHALEPRPELLRVRHGRGQTDEHHVAWSEHYHFFPNRTSERVLEVVDLVQDDEPEAVEQWGAGEEHIAQHFGRHDHHRSFRTVRYVAREKTRFFGPVRGRQLCELLVGQRLQGGRVEGFATLFQGTCDGVVRHHRFARSRGCRDEDGPTLLQCLTCGLLEGIEREAQARQEPRAALCSKLTQADSPSGATASR